VAPKRIAAVLNISSRVVKAFVNLLVDIHPDIVEPLKDKNMSPQTINPMKRIVFEAGCPGLAIRPNQP
jgi:hypothetical protein